ncbi:MAG: hypothetical protein LQ352_007004 [Teloschistes flavicans]|nr:MAG: hypothetical protein LQ352_007004 [Teloschistes flavicans]
MSHGDVKPANTLVHKDGEGETHAKLADFGYTGWAIGNTENILIYPPRSWPWDAPEYHHRGFTVSTAQKMDVYSFGLLCLWVLFFDKQSLSEPVTNETGGNQRPLDDFEQLDCMKHDNALTDFACSQVDSTQSLSAGEKADLVRFFRSAIVFDPQERATNFKEFIVLLGYRWQPGPSSLDGEQRGIDHNLLRFRIADSFYPLMKQNLRVHKYIFICLCERSKGSTPKHIHANDAFQLAFCYKTGFGTAANEPLSLRWLENSQRSTQDIDQEIHLAKESMVDRFYRSGVLQTLLSEALLLEPLGIPQYARDELDIADADYDRVIHDTERAFGPYNCCVLRLKMAQASMLEGARRFKEAEVLRIKLLQDLNNDPAYFQMSQTSKLHTKSTKLATETRRWSRIEERLDGPPLIFTEAPAESPLLMETTIWKERRVSTHNILELWNEDIPDTSNVLWRLAINYTKQGRWSEAESILFPLAKAQVERLGQSHPAALSAAFSLAIVYETLALWPKAEKIYLHVSQIQAHILGKHHRATLDTRASLASIYEAQDRLSEAEQLISQVLAVQRSVIGESDTSTLRSLRIRANICSRQGRFQVSLNLKHELVDLLTGAVGPEHADTLDAMGTIGVDLASLGRWSEVKMMAAQIQERLKAIPGDESPLMLTTMQHLASAHWQEGLLQQSEAEFRQIFQAQCKTWGEMHPETIQSRLNLGVIIGSQGRLDEAENLFMKTLEDSEKHLGETNILSLQVAYQLALLYEKQSRLDEAEKLSVRLLSLGRDTLGEKHADYLGYQATLAEIRCSQKRFKEAETIGWHVLNGYVEVLGDNHSHTIVQIVRLARYLEDQQRWEESNAMYRTVIEQRKRLKGDEHDDTLRIMRWFALSLWDQGRRKEAIVGIYNSSKIVRALRAFYRSLVPKPPFLRHRPPGNNVFYSLLIPAGLAIGMMLHHRKREIAYRLSLGFASYIHGQ